MNKFKGRGITTIVMDECTTMDKDTSMHIAVFMFKRAIMQILQSNAKQK